MPWLILVLAGLCEVVWAVGLKYTDGFTRVWPSLGTLGAIVASMTLLGIALKSLPLGTSYAVWTGIGTVGTVFFGILFLGESLSLVRLGSVLLILLGIIGLKWVTPS